MHLTMRKNLFQNSSFVSRQKKLAAAKAARQRQTQIFLKILCVVESTERRKKNGHWHLNSYQVFSPSEQNSPRKNHLNLST